jgi:hypothetical protein
MSKVLTIELRDGSSVMSTLRFSEADKHWYDIDPDNSPLNVTQGRIDKPLMVNFDAWIMARKFFGYST